MNAHGTPAPRQSPPARSPGGIEITLSRLLRAAMAVSMCLLLAGLIATLAQYWSSDGASARQALIRPETPLPRTLGQVLRGPGASGESLAMLGLLALIATPVLRVAVSAAAFAVRRDWAYVVLTLAVLALLLLSFAVGAAG